MIALLLGCLLLGAAACSITALLRPKGRTSFVVGVCVVAYAEVVAVSHALSFADAYARGWFLVVAVILAAAGGLAIAVVRPPWPSFRLGAAARDTLGDPAVAVLAAVVSLELVYVVALAAGTPPNDFDGLTYHLMRAVLWIQQQSVWPVGGVADSRIDEYQPDASILQGLTMLLSRSTRYAQLVTVVWLVVTILAIYGIGPRLGIDRRKAAFGALLFPTLPIVALQAPTALTDIIVAGLTAAAALFVLGRSSGELALACVAVALLVGTKVTGLFSLPVLLAIALLTLRGRRLYLALAGGAAACVVGGAWFIVNLSRGNGLFGSLGEASKGTGNGLAPILARSARYAAETVELPGARGKDALVYLLVAVGVATAGVLLSRPRLAAVGAALTALPLIALPLESLLHRGYWRAWEAVGQDRLARYGPSRDPTIASNATSWYGPLGVALAVVALVLVVRSVTRRQLPSVAVVLAAAPALILVASAIAVGYHSGNGRYVMSGVALSAATWGLLLPVRSATVAIVAVAATTVVLSFVNNEEKPAGVRLLEGPARASIWSLPPEWAQNIQPELVPLTAHIRAHATPGQTIALTRNPSVRPFVYVGWPGLDHRVAYADTLAEAAERNADWAVLPSSVACEDAWRREVTSWPWTLYRHVPGSGCR